MKKQVLLILIFCSALFYGQNYKALDSLSFVKATEQFIQATGKDFKKVGTGELGWREYIQYKNSNDEIFYIVFFRKNEGENKDLEIKGKPSWTIMSIAAKYLTIFDYYQKYYNPKADKEKIQSLGQEWNSPVKEASIRRSSTEGLWEIKFWK